MKGIPNKTKRCSIHVHGLSLQSTNIRIYISNKGFNFIRILFKIMDLVDKKFAIIFFKKEEEKKIP
jgi:hypothetical protein